VLVTIRLFARLREIAGAAELKREVPEGATAGDVWEAIAGEFGDLQSYAASISCAVNEDYAKLTTRLNAGDEVAFLPPVSGG
jgi:molybdopterin converting factor subunit 1